MMLVWQCLATLLMLRPMLLLRPIVFEFVDCSGLQAPDLLAA